jgi:hypothetical protein
MQKSEQEPDVIDYFLAEIRVHCRDCGQSLEWFGLPVGLSPYRPAVSIDGLELRAPMVIPGDKPRDGLPGYAVSYAEAAEGPIKQ